MQSCDTVAVGREFSKYNKIIVNVIVSAKLGDKALPKITRDIFIGK